ncbi:MAG TPA: TolC family protein [Meiothermus sp.]|nr:TolC family protein [Meiothermus sp.]
MSREDRKDNRKLDRKWIALAAGILALALVLGAARAQPLPEVIQTLAARDANLLEAQRGLTAAQDELRKQQADPDAPPLAVTRAQENLALAQARLAAAQAGAENTVVENYTALLEAQAALNLAQKRLEQANLRLEAVRLRRQAGAISQADLTAAEAAQGRATSDLARARNTLALAQARIPDVEGRPLPEAPALPPGLSWENNLARLQAQHAVREAERAVALASGPDTPPLEVAARERSLESARTTLADLERTLRQAFDAAQNRYAAAQQAYTLAQRDLDQARQALAAARSRLQAGALSRLDFLQSEIGVLEAESALTSALAEVWKARQGVIVAARGTSTGGG